MSTYDWLLMIHVTGAFLFLGGGVAAGILNLRAWHAERPSEVALLLRLIQRVALPAIGVGSVTTLVIGHLARAPRRATPTAPSGSWAAIVLWAVVGALGGRTGKYQERTAAEARRLAESGDTMSSELRALVRDPVGNALAYGSGLTIVLILILMIWKPGQ